MIDEDHAEAALRGDQGIHASGPLTRAKLDAISARQMRDVGARGLRRRRIEVAGYQFAAATIVQRMCDNRGREAAEGAKLQHVTTGKIGDLVKLQRLLLPQIAVDADIDQSGNAHAAVGGVSQLLVKASDMPAGKAKGLSIGPHDTQLIEFKPGLRVLSGRETAYKRSEHPMNVPPSLHPRKSAVANRSCANSRSTSPSASIIARSRTASRPMSP